MREIQFPVDVLALKQERVFIGGRCYADLIQLDDRFTESLGDAGNRVSLVLRVQGILMYGKLVNQLEPGMTAELELVREEGPTPQVGSVLRGTSSLPAFADVEILGEGEFTVETL